MESKDLTLDVLLVEDNPGDARLVEHHLDAPQVDDIAGDVTLSHVESLSEALTELERGSYDILFLDLGLPQSTGVATLERALDEVSGAPIVVLTGLNDRETAVEAIQRGAQDYLLKDGLDADTLARTLRYAVERHENEQKLRRQNERLDQFASVVSHDLRNPLNVAKGRLRLVQDEHESEHIGHVAGALDRMEALIDDLLTLARQGETIDATTVVDVAPVARGCWQNIEMGTASLEVRTQRAIYADESRFKQLLENLFRNAIEHNDDPVTITVGVDDGVLFVEDDGVGIPADDRETVFESGFSTSTDGTGFGLMIVREVASAHGWTIAATESDEGGARFEVSGVEFADE